MTIQRGRAGRADPVSLRAAGIVSSVLALVLCVPAAASAGEGLVSDPRELGATLDLKALTHSDDGSSVVYTAETHAPFTDQSAAFKWGIDRDGDEDFDLFVTTESRGGRLAGAVKDAAGRELAAAVVSRPGPNVIKVSFPVAALGGAGSYRYAVNAGQGETGGDLAPDSGLSKHRLGALARPSGTEPSAAAAVAPVRASLPATGPDHARALLPIAGAAFMAGGALIAAAPRASRRSWRGVR